MAAGGKNRASRENRDRARLYEARRGFHERQQRRRRTDNLVAGIVGGVLIIALFASQAVYFSTGPGAPTPTPTPTTSMESTPAPTSSGTPTPTPTITSTPAP